MFLPASQPSLFVEDHQPENGQEQRYHKHNQNDEVIGSGFRVAGKSSAEIVHRIPFGNDPGHEDAYALVEEDRGVVQVAVQSPGHVVRAIEDDEDQVRGLKAEDNVNGRPFAMQKRGNHDQQGLVAQIDDWVGKSHLPELEM